MTTTRPAVTPPLWTPDPAEVWERRSTDHRLPLWLRVVAYAEAKALPNGHCPLVPEQLHRDLDPLLDKAMISRAIRRAADVGWLHPGSSARCLVLGRASVLVPDCPATHR